MDQYGKWFDLFVVYARSYLVLRSIYIQKEDYLFHLKNTLDTDDGIEFDPEMITRIAEHLPSQFWMVEASCPELFSVTRRKFGEVILVPKEGQLQFDHSSLLFMRLPGCLVFRNANDLSLEISPVQGHTQIFSLETTVS